LSHTATFPSFTRQLLAAGLLLFLTPTMLRAQSREPSAESFKTWQKIELSLVAQNEYDNPYTDAEVWVVLSGPDSEKRVWAFWDGGNTFKVRLLAEKEGQYSWRSYSNPPDEGLSGQTGTFSAAAWTEAELLENPNRRGIIRTNPDAPHSFMYADGTPFFLLADTWWAAMTWRYPLAKEAVGGQPSVPTEEDWSLQRGISWLQKHHYNSIALIAAFPNWRVDGEGRVVQDDNGIYIRKAEAWGKGPLGEHVKDMHDDDGNMPFAFPGKCGGKTNLCADLDRINPPYWRNMDKKMDLLWRSGFVPYVESVRRDQLSVWVHYHDFNESFARYLNYLKARYGTYNMIFSLVHWDWIQPDVRIDHLKGAFAYYHLKYGGMPFGQPVTAMIVESSYDYLGHVDVAPYLTCHSGGNSNRGHGILGNIESFYDLEPAVPGFNNEPYYSLHDVPWNRAGGENIVPNSERDNYFARTHMYSNFFSGALGGHVFGTGAFGGDTVGEAPYVGDPAPWPKIWEALDNDALKKAKHFKEFVDSQQGAYKDMIVAYDQLSAPRNDSDVLDEWSYMLRSADSSTLLLYFEKAAPRQRIRGLAPGAEYLARWYDPRTGEWTSFASPRLTVGANGEIAMPRFPSGTDAAENDWAAQLTKVE
jgi:hypothetical protein